ncbi:MAG TPA: ABC transporter permease [Puia sp.]|jgi:putative ABC transport system permease protein|nr:ABC transporter permease [Puia sp.]
MPANYLKITARRLLRQKTFSLINILGLSIGLAACLLIYLYVHSEMTYDAYNRYANRIARVTSILHSPESNLNLATSPQPLARTLLAEFPQLEAAARLQDSTVVIRQGADLFNAQNFYFSEPAVFSVFDFRFLEGAAAGALTMPHSIVLTRSMEKKYFGNRRAQGQTLICNGAAWQVTAVVADRPANSDLMIDALLSKDYSRIDWSFDDFDTYTFVLFRQSPDARQPTDLRRFNRDLNRMDKYTRPLLDQEGAKGWALKFEAEALTEVHFSQGKLIDTTKGNRQFNTIFSGLALFILMIALLNYINLSTARAAERSKEVGVRKVIGALPGQLIRQFLTESALLVAIAWLIAIGLVAIGIPLFNRALQTRLGLNSPTAILFPILLFPLTVLLAGGYPAFILTRFRPVKVLKGMGSAPSGGAALRKIFTTIQFMIALAMLAGAVIFYQQMFYMFHKDPGISRSGILEVAIPPDSVSRAAAPAFFDALRHETAIRAVSVGSGLPTDGAAMASTNLWSNGKKREILVNYFYIDPKLLPMVHISLTAGRNFSDSLPTDRKEAFIVNEAFVRMAGWASPIGQPIENGENKGKVIGVVKDFFYKSMHNLIEPMVMIYKVDPPLAVVLKMSPDAVPRVRQIWKRFFPATPFDYDFLEKDFSDQYRKDRVTMILFNGFTALSIFISCLGLYGLVSLITLQRSREIAIRKVLGASVSRLVLLLSAGQLWLIAIAALIALPFATLGARKWLTSYAYHTTINVWMFVLPVCALLLLTLTVTGYRILRSALANPADSLRAE